MSLLVAATTETDDDLAPGAIRGACVAYCIASASAWSGDLMPSLFISSLVTRSSNFSVPGFDLIEHARVKRARLEREPLVDHQSIAGKALVEGGQLGLAQRRI